MGEIINFNCVKIHSDCFRWFKGRVKWVRPGLNRKVDPSTASACFSQAFYKVSSRLTVSAWVSPSSTPAYSHFRLNLIGTCQMALILKKNISVSTKGESIHTGKIMLKNVTKLDKKATGYCHRHQPLPTLSRSSKNPQLLLYIGGLGCIEKPPGSSQHTIF